MGALTLSAVIWVAAAAWEDRAAAAQFDNGASIKLAQLQGGFVDYRDVMRDYHGFIEGAAAMVDRERLDRYAAPFVVEYRGLTELAWVPRVPWAERSSAEAAARRDGLTSYRIFRLADSGQRIAPADQAETYPILYATPKETAGTLLGYDLASDPQRRRVVEQARDSGELVVSGAMPLLVGEGHLGMIALQAVYAGGSRPADVDSRRQNLVGFALGAFRLDQMVDGTLARLTKTLGIHTYAYRNGATANELPVYVHTSLRAKSPAPQLARAAVEAQLHVAGRLTFGNQSWWAVLVPMQDPRHGLWGSRPLGLFFLCLGLSAIVVRATLLASRQRQRGIALALEALASKERFSTIFHSVNDGIFLTDMDTGRFVDINQPGCDMFGYLPAELVGSTIVTLSSGIAPYTQAGAVESLAKVRSGGLQRFECHCKRKDGSLFWVEISLRSAPFASGPLGLAVVRDITKQRQASEQIAQMARFDSLTGLANRRVFVETLEYTIARTRRSAKGFAVLYLDLDHFKDVNDTLGHSVGDLLLQAVANRLRASVRATDTVARFGGDEFAVIVSDLREPADAVIVVDRIQGAIGVPLVIPETAASAGNVADKILTAVGQPFSILGNEIHSGATVGIAVYGPDSPDAEALLSHADEALYRAKSEGRGTYRFFTDAMDTEIRARVTMTRELREAIFADQLYLLYQPEVDIETGRIAGLEALVRWHHPTRGDLGPSTFIKAAEGNGLIVPLGRWVMREACRQVKQWSDAGIAPPVVAINVSGLQLKMPRAFEQEIATSLAEADIPASCLELELTESVLMQASREHNDLLLRFRSQGIRIAIDDFGTGYSSLDYLRRHPVDRLKIAQSFVVDLGKGLGEDAIVRAALSLARELGIEVVVEGVENAVQLKLLRSWGCRVVQGFYFARPLAVADVSRLLRIGRITPGQANVVDLAAAG